MRKFPKLNVSVSIILILSILLAACGGEGESSSGNDGDSGDEDGYKVGILFALSGSNALPEEPMHNAALLAIEEINEDGGVLGKPLIPIVEDSESNPAGAAEIAKKVIQQDGVIANIGAYTSSDRQAILPVVEQENNILMYPTLGEGEEYSENIIYVGSVPNQQLEHLPEWLIENYGKKIYLVGNDYIWPVQSNNQFKILWEMAGGEVVGEEYVPMGHGEFSSVISNIREAEPDLIMATTVGDSTPSLYSQHHDAGFDSADMPIVGLTTLEQEYAAMGPEVAEGHISSFSYFMSLDNPANNQFVDAYKAKYGEDELTSGMQHNTYSSVYMLAAAMEKAGEGFTTDDLLEAFKEIEYDSPEGIIKIDEENNYTWLHSRIGKVDSEGQIQVVFEKEGTSRPEPWSELIFPDHDKPWKQ